MATKNTAIYLQTIKSAALTLNPASTTTITNLYTAGTDGSKIGSLIATSTDTAARDIGIYFTIASVTYLIGTVSIPATAGFVNNIPSVNLLRSPNIPGLEYDSNGNPCIFMGSGTSLQVGMLTTITAAKQVQILLQGGDF